MEHAQFWATSDLTMTEAKRQHTASHALAIEEYHCGLKSCCVVERCQARTERSVRYHILLALWAFVRLEQQRIAADKSWYALKVEPIRDAVRQARHTWNLLQATTA